MKRKKKMIEAENILCILLYSLFYKYVNMSYFDRNELICICVILIVIKNLKESPVFKKCPFTLGHGSSHRASA
jgi:hypothetical protein